MSNARDAQPIVVVGAGLSGCCIALLLSKLYKNRPIILIEGRDDYRNELQRINAAATSSQGNFDNAATRSINLALSHRGMCALKACGIMNELTAQNLLILMKGRYIHLNRREHSKQLYGQDHEGIYSISRLTLNCLFLDKLAACDNVQLRFNSKVHKINGNGDVVFVKAESKPIEDALFVLGCDGAYSVVRASLQRLGRYNFNIEYIAHGYKELTIFPSEKDGTFRMEPGYLHIWPKHEFMLIGLPNPDKTFTCTLFCPWTILESLNSKLSVQTFFEQHFPDFVDLCPNYQQQCLSNPSSPLAHVHMSKWNFKSKILLLGDAAHAIVPFYGQGMNAAFEDCLILYEMLQEHSGKSSEASGSEVIERVFEQFSAHRQPSTECLSALSLQNYVEMRSLTAQRWFVWKKKLEKTLNYYVPQVWRPIYSMVAFSRTPYNDAMERANKQDHYLTMALSAMGMISVASLLAVGYKYDVVGGMKKKWNDMKD